MIVRRGQARFGPVALIEHHAQGDGPAVQHEAIALHTCERKRGVGLARDRSTRRDRPTVQGSASSRFGDSRAPQQLVAGIVDAGIGQRDAAMDFATHDVVGIGGERGIAATQLDAEA